MPMTKPCRCDHSASYLRHYEIRCALCDLERLTAAANEVLRVYMPQFNDSRAVDDCLVELAAIVAGCAELTS